MSSSAALSFLLSQTKSNIQFLVSQNHLDVSDGDAILMLLSKSKSSASHSPASSTSSSSLSSIGTPPVLTTSSPTTLDFLQTTPRPAHYSVKALWPYNLHGDQLNDLSFNSGDIIQVTSEINKDWFSGVINDRSGLFPAAYVEKLASKPKQPVIPLSSIPEFSAAQPRPQSRQLSNLSSSPAHMTLTGGFGSSRASQLFPQTQSLEPTGRYTLYETSPTPFKSNPQANYPIGHGRQSTVNF